VYKHEDIERKHIHIVSLRVDENGKKIDDRFEHRCSMDACRELEQKYRLIPADRKKCQEGLPLRIEIREMRVEIDSLKNAVKSDIGAKKKK
jgi:hypothetical protein